MALRIREIASMLLVVGVVTVQASNPVVTVEQGQIVGKQYEFNAADSKYTVDAYLGIPYAEAPIGELRFKPPVPKEWNGKLNAQKYGKTCPQVIMPVFDQIDFAENGMGEDCLILNVFVPQPTPSNAAVMFFIHGGGYSIGVGSIAEKFDFHPLSALGDVIVVTMNYRLNALGFLSTGDEIVPGNNGMLDQVEAMKWVQKNIAAFGGDPSRVTIWGVSAGASSVALHTLSPLSKGLFSQAIMQSGIAPSPWAANTDTENFAKRAFAIGKLVGCEQADTKQLVECLSEVSADEIVNAAQRMMEVFPQDPGLIPFGPVLDGNFLPETPTALMAKQQLNPANIMVGYNADEGTMTPIFLYPNATEKPRINATEFDFLLAMQKVFLAPLHRAATELVYFDDAISPDYFDAFVNIATDKMFACPSDAYLRDAFNANIGQVFAYYFNHHPSKSILHTPWSGACHGDDAMFFGAHFLPNTFDYTEEEHDMSMKMIKYWTNFAKTGNPNLGSDDEEVATEDKELEWPQYTVDTRLYKELAPDMNNIADPCGRGCRLWNDFLPKLDAALAKAGECQEEKSCKSRWAEEDQESCSKDESTP